MRKTYIEIINMIQETELPGIVSHSAMAPKLGNKLYRKMVAPSTVRVNSVLVPIIEHDNTFEILFTQRNKKLLHHPGQISFPGGKIEAGEDAEFASLRETFEEIGIPPSEISVLAKLSDLYVEPSNNLIVPYIGAINNKYWAEISSNSLNISEEEVEGVVCIPIDYFMDSSNRKQQKKVISGIEVDMPFWDIGADVPLWGATAMILSELIDIIEKYS